ncbi:VOC family protein [Flavobacterium suzhouense]|uniref:VOC family protein n=1 Tax=Flavobacterium suzhouense TaxID=1529638 RepID=A0ABW5NPW1_9FLAO
MPQVNPYITFLGTCEDAFNFYKSVFGGEFQYIGRFGEMPDGDKMPEEAKNLIMHVSLPISKETILMGSDSSEAFGQVTTVGNNISVSINTESKEEATRIFNGLSAGGKVTMPLELTFWGAFFGMFTDKFGINWMVNHDTQPQE